jgi:hypothetical protein
MFAQHDHPSGIFHKNCYFSTVEKTRHIFYPLLVAWLIIFVHDTIPHGHHHDAAYACGNDYHQTKDDASRHRSIQAAADHTTCLFSVDILPGLSLDNDLDMPGQSFFIAPGAKDLTHYWSSLHITPGLLHLSQNQLRAPPVA